MKDQTIPSFLISQDGPSIHAQAEQTDAQLLDQGYTYNQPGFSFNQLGVMYGGIYNAGEDIIPSFFNAKAAVVIPVIAGMNDIYTNTTPIPPPANSGMLIGILGLTYP